MEDSQIVALYFDRNEQAIRETESRYGNYCYSIAYNILANGLDAEESVNDTYMAAWNAIPPKRPSLLGAFLGKITRHIAIDRWRKNNAYKRTGGEMQIAMDELGEVAGTGVEPENRMELSETVQCINRYLRTLPETERRIFLCRYWYLDSITEIAEKSGYTESRITSLLHRIRIKLRKQFEKEGLL